MMGRILIYIILFASSATVFGQQENLYSQFAFNKIAFNPGVAGNLDYTTITGVNRSQWSGLVGAPKSQYLNLNLGTVSKRHGFGMSLSNNSIGIQKRIEVAGQYAFKLKIKKSHFNIGLQVSGRRYTTDFTNPTLVALDGFENDPSIERIKYGNTVVNLGVGLFYQSKKIYAGLSVPRLVRGDIDFESINNVSRESRHIFVMLGSKLDLAEDWIYHPQFFFKLTENSPFNLDFLSMFSYQEKIFIGGNFRSGGLQKSFIESFNIILGFQFTNRVFAGMSYDFNLNNLSQYENGSFELLLKYNFKKSSLPKRISNPRYFTR